MEHTFLLADNQDITRYGFRYLIDSYPDRTDDFNVIDVHTRSELIGKLKVYPQAIVVLDYSLFDLVSIEEFLNLADRFSEAHWILFSEDMTEAFIRRFALEQNMSILFKDSGSYELELALRYNLRRERFLSHNVTNMLLSAPSQKDNVLEKLTSTEVEVLKLIAQGKSVKEIAAVRISSIHTITTHKKNIFRKLNVNTIYEATKYALRAGLVEMADYYI